MSYLPTLACTSSAAQMVRGDGTCCTHEADGWASATMHRAVDNVLPQTEQQGVEPCGHVPRLTPRHEREPTIGEYSLGHVVPVYPHEPLDGHQDHTPGAMVIGCSRVRGAGVRQQPSSSSSSSPTVTG